MSTWPVDRRPRLLLASTSVAALLSAIGAPTAFAACNINEVGTSVSSITNSAAITCINVQNSTVSGSVTNTSTGVLNQNGVFFPPSSTGITINNSTVTGSVSNAGTIFDTIPGFGIGINITNNATVAGGIGNSGTIVAPVTGIAVVGVSTFASGIANTGKISSGLYGILVSDVAQFGTSNAGSISNAGTISAFEGINVHVASFSGDISNDSAGTISSNGFGIDVSATHFSGEISNAGAISGGGGIFISEGASFSGAITNSGRISVLNTGIAVFGAFSTFSGNISNSGTISAGGFAIKVSSPNTFVGTIANSGSLTGASFGIDVFGTPKIVGGISNNAGGTIAGTVGIGVGLRTTHGVLGVTSFVGNISNAGIITAGTGVGIIGSTITGAIVDSGTINASRVGINVDGASKVVTTATAIKVSGATFSGGITNSGMISARTGIIVGAQVLTFSGAIANGGTIYGSGGTAIDVSGANNAITINQTAGLIAGAIKLSAQADVLNVSGGTIAGSIVGAGSSDTINLNLGSGAYTFGSTNGFSGINQVNINSGTVIINGTENAANVDVYGGLLAGTGTLDPLTTTIHSGATFAPGNGTPGTSMTIAGNLAFQSGALYVIYFNPTTSSLATVSGTAELSGTVQANFATGSYVSKTYTILTAAGGVNGQFSGLVNVNLPRGMSDTLSYDANDVYLNLAPGFSSFTGLSVNQQNVVNTLNTVFNAAGGLPNSFFSLSKSDLTYVDGEAATDADKGAFQLMNDFLNLMLDPTAGGGGNISGGGATGFAPEQDTSLPADVALAYAKALKAPQSRMPSSFEQRWSAWGSAFGGTSSTAGNALIGSNNVTASDYGFAAGMEYRATPNTVYGFGLAGGGTNWTLAQGLGSGRGDSFQAGLYAKTHFGPAYVSGALGFANHWFTTDRIALGDQLRASFTGQSYAVRLEGGYRYAVPITGAIVGVTPYAALQAQDFHTPSYSETDLTGGGFGLSYASMNATDTRSELGGRFDNLQIVDGMPLILRGRLAWAHDWYTNATALNAAFQALPGSNFTVNGAAPPKNSALTTAAAELHITSHWTAIAKFDGEFGSGAQTYGGTGTLRYTW